MAALQKQYLYKISRNGTFLGVLQNVTSPFTYSHVINSAGASMEVQVGMSTNRSSESVDTLATESGDDIITESGDLIAIERQPDLVGNSNSLSLVRNYNDVEVYEFSPNNPNGKIVFKGYVSKWKANFGGIDIVNFTIISYGAELDNYLIQSTATLDVSKKTGASTIACYDMLAGRAMGQSFLTGSSTTNITVLVIKMSPVGSSASVTVSIYDNPNFSGTPIATSTRTVSGAAAEYSFSFSGATLAPSTTYYFNVVSALGVNLYYGTPSDYANGFMYTASSPGNWTQTPVGIVPDGDLYFATYFNSSATSVPFTTSDPATILESIIDSYVSRGGSVNYSAGTVDFPGTSVSYTFKLNTILEGIQKCLSLAPYDWYFYIDPATNILYFKETGTTADHTMILGRHIKELNVEATIEQLKNVVYFSGGDTGGGVNLFTSQSDSTSLANNKVGLERISDNRVTLSNTASTIMTGFLRENSSEAYNTSIEVLETTYDITLFRIGQIVGFGGFGNFVDGLLLQIVGLTRYADSIVLKLGVLPPRATATIESIIQDITDLETIANPSSPS